MVFSSTQVQSTQPECRYCLESDVQKNLIAPCICKGSFQYVHNECLMKWYDASPEMGLRCSACNRYLARKFTHTLETNPLQLPFMNGCVQNPMLIVAYVHIVFFMIYICVSDRIKSDDLYILVQSIFHGIQIGKLGICITKIQNQGYYWRLWFQNRRLLLPIVHLFILTRLYQTSFIGGVSADICMCIYFYEHIVIVQEINDRRTFEFVDHNAKIQ